MSDEQTLQEFFDDLHDECDKVLPRPVGVVAALAAVMAELPGIGKDERSPEGYSYRGIESIAKHLQPLLAKHGVVITPVSQLHSQAPAVAMKEGWTDTVLDVEWRVYGPDGGFIPARTQGIGRDKSDKGAAKALTQARKNLLLSLFSIADKADDADGQTYEHDRADTEPPASDEHRQAALDAIAALSDGDKELVKLWMRNNRVPSLRSVGATLSQLNALHDRIAELGTEPFDVTANAPAEDNDAVPPQNDAFETGNATPSPVSVARSQLAGSERKRLDSTARTP